MRVIGIDGQQVGVLPTQDAIALARRHGVDLVEVAAKASPPVCRIVDYGKYCYELSKKQKEAKKHQHTNKTKEIQLRPGIDPHDFKIKAAHAIQFLCEDMKVKIILRYRGRELAHKEIGYQRVQDFIGKLDDWGTPDADPKFAGRALSAMVSPKPRNQRAENPYAGRELPPDELPDDHHDDDDHQDEPNGQNPVKIKGEKDDGQKFSNNPFSDLDKKK